MSVQPAAAAAGCVVAAIIGTVTAVTGAVRPLATAGVLLAFSGLIGAVVVAFWRGGRQADRRYELGFDDGYREGHGDGRRVARPVVVPMVRRGLICETCGRVHACPSDEDTGEMERSLAVH